MPLTTQRIEELARILGRKIFVKTKALANSNYDDLKATINRIDIVMGATTNQAASNHNGETIQSALLDEIQTVAPNFSVQQAGIALVIWTAEAAGITDVFDN